MKKGLLFHIAYIRGPAIAYVEFEQKGGGALLDGQLPTLSPYDYLFTTPMTLTVYFGIIIHAMGQEIGFKSLRFAAPSLNDLHFGTLRPHFC